MTRAHPFGPSKAVVAAFLLPSLIGFMLFIFLPAISAVGISFTRYSGGPAISWVGLRNYARAFASTDFLRSVWVTAKFVVVAVALQLLLGFVFALILNEALFGRTFFRGLLFLPSVLSTIAVSLAFMLILNPKQGPANQFLQSIGLQPIPWLSAPETALATIILVAVWQSFGYYMVIFLSGLQSINVNLYEAADIDGAGRLQKLVSVTLPSLTPTLFFCVTIAVIRAFQVFDQIFIMTGGQNGGGPAGSTSVLVFNIYKDAFVHLRFGYASAQSVVLLLIVLTITVIQYRQQRKWVSYDVV